MTPSKTSILLQTTLDPQSLRQSWLPNPDQLEVRQWRPGWLWLSHPGWQPENLAQAWYITPKAPLPSAAQQWSVSAAGIALAMLNFDDDLLRLWAFRAGQAIFEYDSNPSYATCTISSPQASDTPKLAEAFGMPEHAAKLEKLLSRRKGLGFINESGRCALLLKQLGLEPVDSPV